MNERNRNNYSAKCLSHIVRGQDALGAGLLLVPQGAGVAIAMPLAGRLTDRRGARAVVLPGIAQAVTGTLAYTQVTAHTPDLLLAGALVVRGLGLGAMMAPATAASYISLPRAAMGQASSATVVIRQTGGALGTALLAVVLAHNLSRTLPAAARHLGTALPPAARAHLAPALAGAFANTFWVALVLAAAVAIPASLLPRAPLSRRPSHGSARLRCHDGAWCRVPGELPNGPWCLCRSA